MFENSYYFDKQSMTVFFLQGINPEELMLLSAPVSDTGEILFEHQAPVNNANGDEDMKAIGDFLIGRHAAGKL